MRKKTATVKIRTAGGADIEYITTLLGELDRPEPKNKSEYIKFRNLIKKYTQSNNRGMVLAVTSSRIIGLVSFIMLERLNQANK